MPYACGTARLRNEMADMTQSPPTSDLRADFNAFLFAPIGEGDSGRPLSVLSALARLDVDPWDEAARLARLPGEAAIRRFAALIRAVPGGLSPGIDPNRLSAHLIGLLPGRLPAGVPGPGVFKVISQAMLGLLAAYLITIALIAVLHIVMANPPAPAQLDDLPSSPSSTDRPVPGEQR